MVRRACSSLRARALAGLALVVSGACGTAPSYRPKGPASMSAANDDLDVEITGLESRGEDPGLVFVGTLSASDGVAVRGAQVTNPEGQRPCASTNQPASELSVDGAPTWQRPFAVGGEHALRLDFPRTVGFDALVQGPLAVDLETTRAGVDGCLRVPIQGGGDRATWTAVSPWMVGLRVPLSLISAGVGVGVGRWLGSLAVVGVEGDIGLTRATTAALADIVVWRGTALEASYGGFWDLPGGTTPAGTFRHGPAFGVVLGQVGDARRERVQFGGVTVDVAHWSSGGGQAAFSELRLSVHVWLNPVP